MVSLFVSHWPTHLKTFMAPRFIVIHVSALSQFREHMWLVNVQTCWNHVHVNGLTTLIDKLIMFFMNMAYKNYCLYLSKSIIVWHLVRVFLKLMLIWWKWEGYIQNCQRYWILFLRGFAQVQASGGFATSLTSTRAIMSW